VSLDRPAAAGPLRRSSSGPAAAARCRRGRGAPLHNLRPCPARSPPRLGPARAARQPPFLLSPGPSPRSMDVGAFRQDLAFFNHRGKALPYGLPNSL
jgi:hypothetical protein